jgi:transposase
VLELNFHWKKLSVIGGITIKSLYFQLHEDTVKAPEAVAFLRHLQRHMAGKLLLIWAGLPAHRSKVVSDYLGSTEGRLWVERLPGYAPELNPIEYLRGYARGNDLAGFAPKQLWELQSRGTPGIRPSPQGQALPASLLDPVRLEPRRTMNLFWNAQ